MKNYADLYNYILKGKNKVSRTIANNTTARLENNGDIIITLHSTDICILQSDNTRTFYTGGWYTVTTKERINRFMPAPYKVYQADYSWYVWNCRTQERVCEFCNGLTITGSGEVLTV